MKKNLRLLLPLLLLLLSVPTAQAQTAAAPVLSPSEELALLFEEDQADRRPGEGKQIDWSVVDPRDKARQARVKELYNAGGLDSGADYYHAAMVLQHSEIPEDFLLAHHFCIVAIGKGHEKAKWLAAATLDRFLMKIGRPQQFATQYNKENPTDPKDPWRLYNVGPEVNDSLRKAFNVPPLAVAREREAQLNQKMPAQQ